MAFLAAATTPRPRYLLQLSQTGCEAAGVRAVERALQVRDGLAGGPLCPPQRDNPREGVCRGDTALVTITGGTRRRKGETRRQKGKVQPGATRSFSKTPVGNKSRISSTAAVRAALKRIKIKTPKSRRPKRRGRALLLRGLTWGVRRGRRRQREGLQGRTHGSHQHRQRPADVV